MLPLWAVVQRPDAGYSDMKGYAGCSEGDRGTGAGDNNGDDMSAVQVGIFGTQGMVCRGTAYTKKRWGGPHRGDRSHVFQNDASEPLGR